MKCGLGNWLEVENQFVKTKSAKDCEEHYYTFYNRGREDYIPKDEDFIIVSRYGGSTRGSSGQNSQGNNDH